MPRIGLAEFLMLLVLMATWVIPVAIAVWAVVTLQRIRSGQDAIRSRLDTIENLIQRVSSR